MKKDLRTKLINRKIEKPNRFLMTLLMWALRLVNRHYGVKFTYDYDPDSIKDGPTILLSSHASRLEFIYTLYGFGRKDINVVCGYQNILQKGVYHLLLRLGVISKYLYQPDFMCVKNMLRVLRRGGAIGVFPEGIQSSSGSTHPINPATAQFIKRSRANVVVCTTQGAYLATNRYSSDRKKGYIGVNYQLLFTPSTLEDASEQQIYERMLQSIRYNDFEFNKTARHPYVGKESNAHGIDNILYKCPDCGSEQTLFVEQDSIKCRHCGLQIRVNEYYDLVAVRANRLPEDIDSWYKWQRRCVSREIRDDGFEMSLQASLCTVRVDKLRRPPHDREILSVGTARLTNRGLCFEGALNGQGVSHCFDAGALYSLTFSTKGYLEFYYNNDYYMIVPEQSGKGLIKWTLAAEEIHNLYDENWRAASADVYDYDKGETSWTSQEKSTLK